MVETILKNGIFMFLCRFCELRVEYDRAQDKIREMERDTESLRRSMEEQEERHKTMYLKMYMKGQEAAKFEHADQVRGHKTMHLMKQEEAWFGQHNGFVLGLLSQDKVAGAWR
jgi:hypothetical protein